MPAALVLIGGKVITQDPDRPEATAVAIEQGRLVAVGNDDKVRTWVGPGTRVVELDGKTVVPGLVDAHLHLLGLGEQRSLIALAGTRSIQEIREKVAKGAERTPPGGWVLGRGWDQNDWTDRGGRFPTAADLDGLPKDHPILLRRIDGHAAWVNQSALKAAGIDRTTPDPPGGKILREGGTPTGVLIDRAMDLVQTVIPPPSPEELERRALLGQAECLAAGLTEVHEMGLGRAELEALQRLEQRGALKLRINALIDGNGDDFERLVAEGPLYPQAPAQHLTIRGVKFLLDGALGSRGAALLAPYDDDPGNSGLLLLDEAAFEARVRRAKEAGFQVATHAIGDGANRLALEVYQRVFGADLRRLRPRIEHAQVISQDDLPRFGQLGVIASMQPTHATSDMLWAEQRVGPERIRGAYAWATLLATGAVVAAGSDAPIEAVSPLLGLFAARTRQDPSGHPSGGWYPKERMSAEAALAAFTKAGAFAAFKEDRAGMIREGFDADLTVLPIDPTSADPANLTRATPELTIVAGEIVSPR